MEAECGHSRCHACCALRVGSSHWDFTAPAYAASASQRSRCSVLAFANRTNSSPWQARGAHQHPSTNPRSSSRAANNAAFSRSQLSYSPMHSPRCAVLADHERVAPLRGAPYVNVVALALAVNRTRPAELHIRWDEQTAGSPC